MTSEENNPALPAAAETRLPWSVPELADIGSMKDVLASTAQPPNDLSASPSNFAS